MAGVDRAGERIMSRAKGILCKGNIIKKKTHAGQELERCDKTNGCPPRKTIR